MDAGPSSESTDDGDDDQLDNMLFTEDEIVNAIGLQNYKTTQPVFKEKPCKNTNNRIAAEHFEHNYAQSSTMKGTTYLHTVQNHCLYFCKENDIFGSFYRFYLARTDPIWESVCNSG